MDGIDLRVEAGTIHALVGENGAGKSTCLGVLAGRVTPDSGTVTVAERPHPFGSPRQAARAGVAAIYQELSVVPTLTALENVFLGQERRRASVFEDRRRMREQYRALCARLDVAIAPAQPVAELSIGDQQMIEIMRALVGTPTAILLDEPTAALGPRERSVLYRVVRELKADGVTIIFVSHNLDEVLDLADHATVFRDGRISESRPTAEWTKADLTRAMVGHSLSPAIRTEQRNTRPRELLAVENLTVGSKIQNLSLSLAEGEVVGIAGLVGSGRTTLLRALAGDTPPASGSMRLHGDPRRWPRSVREARRAGIALLTEDRKRSGLFAEATSSDNLLISNLGAVSRLGVVSGSRSVAASRSAATAVRLSEQRLSSPVGVLSGGNQQKVLLARAVHFQPKVFLADEPNRGVDVGAKAEIAASLRGMAAQGSAILVVSSEFEDLYELCDRVLVMWRGTLVAELIGPEITIDAMVSKVFGPGGAVR
nr:sugar ABC transporter ATP-binding protein [Planosporangium flavigriseum]